MFHIDHIHWANPFREIKDFVLGEWLRCEPTFVLLPNDRWIQTFFNRRPDGKTWRKVIAINRNITSIADANLIDLIEDVILRITREHICHAWLHAKANECEQTFLFPLLR